MDGLVGSFFALCLLGLFLLLGKFLRAKVRLFQNIFLPSSIIGGFIALALGPYMGDLLPVWIYQVWSQFPGLLISVVFATLFLGVTIPRIKKMWALGGSQLCFGMFAGVGQYFVALILTLLVLTPLFDVPPIFACILEIGFAGGHGTAAGMAPVFDQLGFPAGGALGQMSATVGIIAAVVGGVIFINIAIRKGYCATIDKNSGIPEHKKIGLLEPENQTSIARGTVASESIEPFAFHWAIVGVSILIGWGILALIKQIHPVLKGFPLFPLAMVGGMLIQWSAQKTGAVKYFDRQSFERILGFSLDILVVAAIASLRLDLFIANIVPFTLLMITGIMWLFLCLVYLAPRMFPNNWLERGVTEYGMQSGVTAIGLLLLRLVDPQYKTDTAQAFGFKQMLYEPFLGGGLITATAPFIIMQFGVITSILVCGGVMALFLALAWLNGWWGNWKISSSKTSL